MTIAKHHPAGNGSEAIEVDIAENRCNRTECGIHPKSHELAEYIAAGQPDWATWGVKMRNSDGTPDSFVSAWGRNEAGAQHAANVLNFTTGSGFHYPSRLPQPKEAQGNLTTFDLIAEAANSHERFPGDTNVCARDDEDWPCLTSRLAAEMAKLTAERDNLREDATQIARLLNVQEDASPAYVRGAIESLIEYRNVEIDAEDRARQGAAEPGTNEWDQKYKWGDDE